MTTRTISTEYLDAVVADAVRAEREAIATWLDELVPGFQCLRHELHAEHGWAPECIAAAIRARR